MKAQYLLLQSACILLFCTLPNFSGAQSWVNAGFSIGGGINALTNSGGTMYIGGNFERANGIGASYFLNYDGSTMSIPTNSTLTGSAINGFFSGTSSTLGYNGLFAFGNYSAGSTTQANVTKWSGLQWGDTNYASFATPGTTNAMTSGFMIDNKIMTMVGGAFNSSTLKYVARRNTANNAWIAAGDGFDGIVYALKVFGVDMYAAGSFTKSGTTTVNRVAKWDNANSKWVALGTGSAATLGFNGTVRCLEVHNGELYAGGDFTTASGVAAKLLSKWDATNNKWVAVTNGQFTGTSIRAMANGNSSLMIGGNFTKVGSITTKNATLMKITGTTPAFTAYGQGITSTVNTIIYYVNKWYCGQEVAAGATNYLKVWNPTAIVSTENIFGSTLETINLDIAPNPTTDYCTLRCGQSIDRVEVFNIAGALAFTQNSIRAENYTLDTENLNNGIYIVKITTANGKIGVKKLMVQH